MFSWDHLSTENYLGTICATPRCMTDVAPEAALPVLSWSKLASLKLEEL
jgi:hypothetical protein